MQIENLKAYIANVGMTSKDFSEMIGCTRPFLSAVINGKKFPSKTFQRKVYEITEGEIILPLRQRKNAKKSTKILK